jgi:SAM-dependent methyltransferase
MNQKATAVKEIVWEEAHCLFCAPGTKKERLFQSPDRLNGLPGQFSVSRCAGCDLVFQDPRPTEDTVQYAYPDTYVAYTLPPAKEVNSIKRTLSNLIFANFFGYRHLAPNNWALKLLFSPAYYYLFRHQTIPRFVPNGRLLEIGCSHGYRLEKDRRRGWQVTGLDFHDKSVEAGRANGLDLHCGSVYDFEFPRETFDAVIFDMVLEHLHRPRLLIDQVSKWLKPGGQIIFCIPYFEGVEFRLFRQYAYGLQVPAHLYFYNKWHLRQLLKGFHDVEFRFQHMERDFTIPLAYLNQERPSRLLGFISTSSNFQRLVWTPLSFALSALHLTSRITVRAEK